MLDPDLERQGWLLVDNPGDIPQVGGELAGDGGSDFVEVNAAQRKLEPALVQSVLRMP